MSNVYEILEICLQEIENGADVDSVLFRYSKYADELRPILEASMNAKNIAAPAPSSEVLLRNRAKILQHAAEMREAKVKPVPAHRLWSVPLRRVLVTLIVIAALFMSSTSLVRAASTTLPGDQLYPVKRTWEDVLVTFTFNVKARESLEVEHENKRLTELKDVFARGRSVQVDFSGVVTRQNADLWLVAGIPVAVSAQTEIPVQSIAVGNAIHVEGITQKDGAVLAQKIELLPNGVPLPKVNDDDSSEIEHETSGKGSDTETPNITVTQIPEPETESESGSTSAPTSEPKEQSISGVVQSINGKILVVDGQIMNVSTAEINGTPKVGAAVKVEGYYDANGLFIVTKIEFASNDSSGDNNTSNSKDGKKDSGSNDSGSNTSSGDDHGGDNGGSSGGQDSGSSGGEGGTSGGGGD